MLFVKIRDLLDLSENQSPWKQYLRLDSQKPESQLQRGTHRGMVLLFLPMHLTRYQRGGSLWKVWAFSHRVDWAWEWGISMLKQLNQEVVGIRWALCDPDVCT